MSAQFNTDLLKRFIAPGIDEKPDAALPDLAAEFPEAQGALQRYFLNSVFHGAFTDETKLYAESVIARVQIAFAGYENARAKITSYALAWQPGSPGIGRYLAAVGAWEGVFLNLQILLDLIIKFFEATASAGGREERIRLIANRIKHVSEDIRDGRLSAVGIPLWLTKHGFATIGAALTYDEMGRQVRFMIRFADCLSMPTEAKSRFEALDALLAENFEYEWGP